MTKLPNLPDTARSLLKSMIVSLGATGLISGADAEYLIHLLRLGNA